MGRKKLIRTASVPYHVTSRSNNRDWFYLPLPEVWEIFQHYLGVISERYGVQIHAFVLMSNHFHLLLTTPNKNLDDTMKYFLREVCRRINYRSDRTNHVFGGPYKWSLIGSSIGYKNSMKYVFRNPVKAGICKKVEDYRYSSIHENQISFPLVPSAFEISGQLTQNSDWRSSSWLNLPFSNEEDDCLRRALRRKEFKLTPQRNRKELPESLRAQQE